MPVGGIQIDGGIGACQKIRKKKKIQCLLKSYKSVGWQYTNWGY